MFNWQAPRNRKGRVLRFMQLELLLISNNQADGDIAYTNQLILKSKTSASTEELRIKF
jgi:hypothetical protein